MVKTTDMLPLNRRRFRGTKQDVGKRRPPSTPIGHRRVCSVCGGDVYQSQDGDIPYKLIRQCYRCGYKFSAAQWGLLRNPVSQFRA